MKVHLTSAARQYFAILALPRIPHPKRRTPQHDDRELFTKLLAPSSRKDDSLDVELTDEEAARLHQLVAYWASNKHLSPGETRAATSLLRQFAV